MEKRRTRSTLKLAIAGFLTICFAIPGMICVAKKVSAAGETAVEVTSEEEIREALKNPNAVIKMASNIEIPADSLRTSAIFQLKGAFDYTFDFNGYNLTAPKAHNYGIFETVINSTGNLTFIDSDNFNHYQGGVEGKGAIIRHLGSGQLTILGGQISTNFYPYEQGLGYHLGGGPIYSSGKGKILIDRIGKWMPTVRVHVNEDDVTMPAIKIKYQNESDPLADVVLEVKDAFISTDNIQYPVELETSPAQTGAARILISGGTVAGTYRNYGINSGHIVNGIACKPGTTPVQIDGGNVGNIDMNNAGKPVDGSGRILTKYTYEMKSYHWSGAAGMESVAFDPAISYHAAQMYCNINSQINLWLPNKPAGKVTAIASQDKCYLTGTVDAGGNAILMEEKRFSVQYITNGGLMDGSIAFHTPGGEKLTRPADPVKEGYAFNGWYKDYRFGQEWDFSRDITSSAENTNLYAKWTANTYTVTLDKQGGTGGAGSMTVTYDSAYGTLPTPTKDGYNFDGWYTKATEGTRVTGTTVYTTAAASTLYARWSTHTHTYGSYFANDETGHWRPATCGHTDIKGSFSEHAYENWTIYYPATCLRVGMRERSCSVCLYQQTEEIPTAEHTYGEWTTVTAPACTAAGSRKRTCTVCGNTDAGILPAIGHSRQPDCKHDADGHWYACANDASEKLDLNAHDFSDGKKCSECQLAYAPVTVQISGGTVNGLDGSAIIQNGSHVTVTARDDEAGKTFQHWADSNGNILSTNKSYTFKVSGNMSLRAVYDIAGEPDGGSGGAVVGAVLGIVFGLILIFLILYILWKYDVIGGKVFHTLIRWFDPAAVAVCRLFCRKDRLFTVKGTKREQKEAGDQNGRTPEDPSKV